MIHARCQGCGRRTLLVSFRGDRCLSCVLISAMNSYDERGKDRDYGWDAKLMKARASNPGVRLDQAIIDEARRLKVEEGLTHREIGRRLKVPSSTICNHVPRLGQKRRWTEELITEARAMRASGMTLAAIGRHFGVSAERMCKFVPRTKAWAKRGGKVAA